MPELVDSIPDGVSPTAKVPGLYPSLTVAQWNGIVDTITVDEQRAGSAAPYTMNCDALDARDAIRDYLRQNGYRNPHVS